MWSVFLLICSCLLTLAASWPEQYYTLENVEQHFERFIQEHDRQYADEFEKQARFQIFKDNLEDAIRMNERSDHAVFGITKFMDLTHEEFLDFYTGLETPNIYEDNDCSSFTDSDIPDVNAPESFDWREYNAVTPIKDQKYCGSCFAFSATGNIEGQYAIKYKQLVELSEQQIVDCDKISNGCDGGLMTLAFRSIIELGGIESETDYPYLGYDDQCHFNVSKVKVKLADCHVYSFDSQEKVKQLLYSTGPISIAITANNLQKYKGGILSDAVCGMGRVNHAVLLVGYGIEDGKPYWIVKNSWGKEHFGEEGYFRMERGEGHTSCMMMREPMASSVVA